MTAEQKATDLVTRMYTPYFKANFATISNSDCKEAAKHCALTAVEEIMNIVNPMREALEIESDGYWENVQSEINKL